MNTIDDRNSMKKLTAWKAKMKDLILRAVSHGSIHDDIIICA